LLKGKKQARNQGVGNLPGPSKKQRVPGEVPLPMGKLLKKNVGGGYQSVRKKTMAIKVSPTETKKISKSIWGRGRGNGPGKGHTVDPTWLYSFKTSATGTHKGGVKEGRRGKKKKDRG